MPPHDDLPKRLAAGEPQAYEAAYDLYGPSLLATAWRLLDSRVDAEDAVQEVFVAMVKSRHNLARVTNLRGYLFASLRHAAARIHKRRLRLDAAMDWTAQADSPAESSDGAERLWQFVARLPDNQREVVALKINSGLTFQQIADVLGLSINTAASRYRYALEKLRQMESPQ